MIFFLVFTHSNGIFSSQTTSPFEVGQLLLTHPPYRLQYTSF